MKNLKSAVHYSSTPFTSHHHLKFNKIPGSTVNWPFCRISFRNLLQFIIKYLWQFTYLAIIALSSFISLNTLTSPIFFVTNNRATNLFAPAPLLNPQSARLGLGKSQKHVFPLTLLSAAKMLVTFLPNNKEDK